MTGRRFIDHDSRGSRKQVPPRRESSVDRAVQARRTDEFRDSQGRLHRISLGTGALVGSGTTIEMGIPLSNHVILGERNAIASAVGPYTHTGDDVKISRGVRFATSGQKLALGDTVLVRIGDKTQILPGTILYPRTNIGEKAIIQASIIGQFASRRGFDQREKTSIGEGVVVQQSEVQHGVTIGRGNHILPGTVLPTGVIIPDNDTESLQKVSQSDIDLLSGAAEKAVKARSNEDLIEIQPGELTVRQMADECGVDVSRIYKALDNLFSTDEITFRRSRHRRSKVVTPDQQPLIVNYLGIGAV